MLTSHVLSLLTPITLIVVSQFTVKFRTQIRPTKGQTASVSFSWNTFLDGYTLYFPRLSSRIVRSHPTCQRASLPAVTLIAR